MDSANVFERVCEQQRQWAEAQGLVVGPKGYLTAVEENLLPGAMCDETRHAFQRAAGQELDGKKGQQPNMCALHSSAALVCNVFEYWSAGDPGAIGRALEIYETVTSVTFGAQLPTGLPGTPPTLDLLLQGEHGFACGVESKFTEPFQVRADEKPFADSYFSKGRTLWNDLGLPSCEVLARNIADGETSFDYLDAAQLLKHVLGLRRHYPAGQLILLWYRPEGEIGNRVKAEADRFAAMVDVNLGFRDITYQEVFENLKREPAASNEYLEYLGSRYFGQ